MEERVSEALKQSVDEAAEAIQDSDVLYGDETPWREENYKAYLWMISNMSLAVFVIARSREAEVSKRMLRNFKGILVTDRYKGYLWYPMLKRAICHAHLKRDFQRMVDRGGESQVIGQRLLDEQARMFAAWHDFRKEGEGGIDFRQFEARIKPIRARVKRWLKLGTKCTDKKTRGTCRDLLRHWDALWTFVYEEGVEPTNNHGERIVRKGVMWRKICFGTQSASGSRFVERILTVTETCRLQGRCLFTFLLETMQAALTGGTPPSLIPVTTTRLQT
jgi:transposase